MRRRTIASLAPCVLVAATCAAPAQSVGVAVSASGNTRAVAVSQPQRTTRSHFRPMAPPGCSSNVGLFFIGIPGFDFAQYTSGVGAGGFNASCDVDTAIGAGGFNVIGGDASSYNSMIGTGNFNATDQSPYSFIGAGTQNAISGGADAAIAAGQSNKVGGSVAFIGAGVQNTIDSGSAYAFVGSGYGNSVNGKYTVIAGGQGNASDGNFEALGGGSGNQGYGDYSTVMGGQQNESAQLAAAAGQAGTGTYAVVLGGYQNGAEWDYDTVVGGSGNLTSDNSGDATTGNFIGGGTQNEILEGGADNGNYCVMLGGSGNSVFIFSGDNNVVIAGGTQHQSLGSESVIVGGYGNHDNVQAYIGGGYANIAELVAAIGGGHANTAGGNESGIVGGSNNTANGTNATVPGGQNNVAAGIDSFAAGTASQAINNGTFVWSDDAAGAKTLASTASNQFLVRASSGITLYSSANLKSGVKLAPGSGSWSNVSDRNVKTGIRPLDDARMLAHLAALPVTTWSYAAQGTAVRHIGPMTQDFRAAFGLGEDATHISTVDEEGVALAAVRALAARVADKDRELSELQAAHAARRTVLAELAARMAALESSHQPAGTRNPERPPVNVNALQHQSQGVAPDR